MDIGNDPKWSRLRETAEAAVRDNFLELFDLKTRSQGKKLVVTLVIDKKDGLVKLEECAAVSRDFEKRLDELNLIESSYLLEVSSPGLDRPLRNPEDFRRFKGRLASILLAEPMEGRTDFRGRLGEVQGDRVEFLAEGGNIYWIPFSAMKRANLAVEI